MMNCNYHVSSCIALPRLFRHDIHRLFLLNSACEASEDSRSEPVESSVNHMGHMGSHRPWDRAVTTIGGTRWKGQKLGPGYIGMTVGWIQMDEFGMLQLLDVERRSEWRLDLSV